MPGTVRAVGRPFQDAVDYFRQKVNVPSEHWTTLMDEMNARAFAVAGATSDDLIKDLRAAVDKGISQGTTLETFREDFAEIVKRHGWAHSGTAQWRSKIIYETNLSNAFSAGRYAQQTTPAVLAAYPYFEYVHVNCPHPRLQHVAWSGTILRADDPWWDTHYTPNGWGCHCIVTNLGPRQLAQRGIDPATLKAPPIQWMEYKNRTTGTVTKYPAGIDPGFAYNPGKVWKEGKPQPLKAPRVRPVSPPPPVLAPPGEPSVPPPVVDKFVADPDGSIQVGELTGPARDHLGASDEPVLLSKPTMKAQATEQPKTVAADYRELPEIIAKPDLVITQGALIVHLVKRVERAMLAATIERTGSGEEIHVTALQRLDAGTLQHLVFQGQVLAGDAVQLQDWLSQQAPE